MSARLRSLVDSGARQTLASFEVAADLGFSAVDLSALPTTRVVGLGGVEQSCHEARLELLIGPASPGYLALPDARVFFVPQLVGDYDVLLGQCDALERLVFVQRNQQPRPEFVLRRPLE